MDFLDDIDIKILKENFDKDLIKQIDPENVVKIFKYLNNNGVYYTKDLFLESLDLFLFPYENFVMRFEYLKTVLGNDYVDKLGEDISLIEFMY